MLVRDKTKHQWAHLRVWFGGCWPGRGEYGGWRVSSHADCSPDAHHGRDSHPTGQAPDWGSTRSWADLRCEVRCGARGAFLLAATDGRTVPTCSHHLPTWTHIDFCQRREHPGPSGPRASREIGSPFLGFGILAADWAADSTRPADARWNRYSPSWAIGNRCLGNESYRRTQRAEGKKRKSRKAEKQKST